MAGELRKKLEGLIQNEVGKRSPSIIGRVEDVDGVKNTATVTIQNPSGNGFIRIVGSSLPIFEGVNPSKPRPGKRVILHSIHGNYTYSGISSILSKEPDEFTNQKLPRNGAPQG